MLYVSKRVGRDRYQITDTDDGTTEEVSLAHLTKAINLGVEILGVERYKGRFDTEYFCSANVYTPDSAVTGKSAKLKTLSGVDIRVNGNEIVLVTISNKVKRTSIVRIKLSDYGTSLADSAFVESLDADHVVIVLDDSVKLRKNSLREAFVAGYRFDITALTNPRFVEYVYAEYIRTVRNLVPSFNIIFDDPERNHKYMTVWSFYHEKVDTEALTEEDLGFVEAYLYDKFVRLSKLPISISSDKQTLAFVQTFINSHLDWTQRNFWRDASLRDNLDFQEVYYHDLLNIFAFDYKIHSKEGRTIVCFKQYILYGEPSKRMQDLYIKYCVRLYNALLDYERDKLWRL